jgi:hypothetical protein
MAAVLENSPLSDKTSLFCSNSGYCIVLRMSANDQRFCIKVGFCEEFLSLDEPYLFGIFIQYLEKIYIFPKDSTFLGIPSPFSKLPLGLSRRKPLLWKSFPLSGNLYRVWELWWVQSTAFTR